MKENEKDELFNDAARLIVREQNVARYFIQKKLKIGYSRAGRIMEELAESGVIGGGTGGHFTKINFKTEKKLCEFLKIEYVEPLLCAIDIIKKHVTNPKTLGINTDVEKDLEEYFSKKLKLEKEFYCVKVRNKELAGIGLPDLYFQDKFMSERVMAAFNVFVAEGKSIEWDYSIVHPLSEQQVLDEMLALLAMLYKKWQNEN